MPDLGIGEIALLALVIFALFGYKRLPDAARSLGRSMRVFRAETRGLQEDDVRAKAEPHTARGPLGNAAAADGPAPSPTTEHKPAPEDKPAQPSQTTAP